MRVGRGLEREPRKSARIFFETEMLNEVGLGRLSWEKPSEMTRSSTRALCVGLDMYGSDIGWGSGDIVDCKKRLVRDLMIFI